MPALEKITPENVKKFVSMELCILVIERAAVVRHNWIDIGLLAKVNEGYEIRWTFSPATKLIGETGSKVVCYYFEIFDFYYVHK